MTQPQRVPDVLDGEVIGVLSPLSSPPRGGGTIAVAGAAAREQFVEVIGYGASVVVTQ